MSADTSKPWLKNPQSRDNPLNKRKIEERKKMEKSDSNSTGSDAETIAALAQAGEAIKAEVGKIIVGQTDVINQVLTAFFARGHCVIEGVPGLAKTLMISSLTETMSLDFTRVQFTPDLMPTDITGTTLLNEDEHGKRHFTFAKGPVFTNILLADEINRTPPKTQAALLEAMQERNVSVGGESYKLPEPFLVLATQNPIEQEGTYALPEAQLDRFLFLVRINYPSLSEEEKILLSTTLESLPKLEQIIDGPTIIGMQKAVRGIGVSHEVANYAARLARATRPGSPEAPDFVNQWVRWGCGPRAGQGLLLAAKSNAGLSGRSDATIEDVQKFVLPVLRHRMGLNFAAVSEGQSTDDIVDMLVKHVPEKASAAASQKVA
ncbi:MoxR family ATPase [Verrucomicrobia bacterium]|nr:MoxR family ATPase [Verrucomicrobiota bacterium]